MDKYIGCKLIEAEPMDLGTYNSYRGWKIPENEDPGREGYLVRYPDGYESWSPKEIFEQAYMKITPNPKLLADEVSISPQMVEDFIKYVDVETRTNHRTGRRTTHVTVTLVNGFELSEASTCVIDRNYSEELGKEACMGKIRDKIWFLLGFLLQTAVGGVK